MTHLRAAALAVLFATGCGHDFGLIGEIDHKYILKGPKVDDETIGKSKTFPVALQIVVDDDKKRAPADIGRIVDRALFSAPEYPRFIFKVVFANADSDLCGDSDYANPDSIWFNVFFGYYEIVVAKSQWTRPFGYERVDGKLTIRFEDLVRLGKADWNYFSNHIYGVPRAVVAKYDTIDVPSVHPKHHGRVKVGKRHWDLVEMTNVEVVSPYVSTQDALELVTVSKGWTPAWQATFGTFEPDDSRPTSFGPTRLHAKIYLSWRNDKHRKLGDVYKTVMFGGTVNQDYPNASENDRFMELQLESLRELMVRSPRLGFVSP